MNLIGRERELDRAARFLERARNERVARILRITGNSGYGKTALCREVQRRADADGWVVAYVAAHRIQSALPLVVLRRLSEEILRSLGNDGAKYASGLETALAGVESEPKTFEAALVRLIEGVLHDRQLLVIVDDAQWSDAESRAVLPRVVQSLADRTLALVLAERIDESSDLAIDLADDTIVLNELNAKAGMQVARELMPGASDEVVAAVVEHARGRPVDIATIASLSSDYATMTVSDVTESARSIIAREIAALPAATREFLQLCSLIGDPLDYELLTTLWPESTLLDFVRATSGRYITQDDGLRFVHATVGQSVLETIAIEIPYRKRIIAAIESMPSITPERYEVLVEQAAGCGDRSLEFKYLTELAREATKRGSVALTASALERAITLAPDGTDVVALYTQVAGAYNALGREDASRVAREGLERAAASGLTKGTGALVAALLFSLWLNGDRRTFDNALAQYEPHLSEPSDRAQVLSMLLYTAYCDNDDAAFSRFNGQLRSAGASGPMQEVRYECFSGMLRARAGHFDDAHRSLNAARAIVERHSLGFVSVMVNSAEVVLLMHSRGVGHDDLRRAVAMLDRHDPLRATTEAMELLAQNSPRDAMDRANEAYLQQNATFARRALLAVAGAIAALTQIPLSQHLMSDLMREAGVGSDAPSLAPVLSAAAALSSDPLTALRFAQRAVEIAKKPLEAQNMWLPVVLAQGAANGKSTEVLTALASTMQPHDAFPWTQAHHQFGRLTAMHALKRPVDKVEATALATRFNELGATYFADLTLALGAKSETPKTESASTLSRREREVAELVAEGKSNREIAESLVLSERTVEGHIANIFAKLNVGSRAQIATWFVTLAR